MIDFVKKKKYWIISVLLVIVLSGFAFYQYKSKSSTPQYTTAAAAKGTIISSISASGSVTSSNFYSLKTSSSGTITSVLIKDGDMVKKGQKLIQITLDSDGQQNYNKAYTSLLAAQTTYNNAVSGKTILENNLAQAESSVSQQKIDAEKTLNSAKAGLISAQSDRDHASGTKATKLTTIALDSAKRTLEVAQMQYDAIGSSSDQNQTNVLSAQNKLNEADSTINQARTNLYSTQLDLQSSSPSIYAPIDGLVSGLSVFEGMTIANTSSGSSTSGTSSSTSSIQLLSIANQTNPLISVNVAESDINKIKVDQKVNITLDAISDKTFTGKVVGINKMGSVSSNVTNYPITIQLDTQSSDILPNMSATVEIVLDSKTDALLIPSSALKSSDTGYYVQVLASGKAETKVVIIGINSDTQTEIVSGLNEGDQVITGVVNPVTTKTTTGSSSVFGGITTGGANSFGSSGNSRVRSGSGPQN